MAPPSTIWAIGRWKTDWEILVKVHRKWFCHTGEDVLHFIFVDTHGTKIQATVQIPVSVPRFDALLPEGQWKIIKNFVVTDAPSPKRLTKCLNRIYLVSNTVVRESEQISTDHFFDFISFDKLQPDSRNGLPPYPVDVVGSVYNVGELNLVTHASLDRRVCECELPFTIRDIDGDELEVVAKGEIAIDFYNRWNVTNLTDIVCVFSDWRVDDQGGVLQDEGGISRFFFKLQIEEVLELQDCPCITVSNDDGDSDGGKDS